MVLYRTEKVRFDWPFGFHGDRQIGLSFRIQDCQRGGI